ncbi:alpha-1A adrenergic receptor-like [Lampris incognitus]|uniref:alpha-1A adrenergic receptor-like n=1 Tax=Lampris incognitus TaxID=2546036 RepID=UPI0024B4B2BA|nr:alpha-1A adrenergic receptor-like [Lampris incognitus]
MNRIIDNATNLWKNGSSELHRGTVDPPFNFSSNSTGNQTGLSEVDLIRAIPLGLVLGAFIVFAIAGNILVILSVVCNRHLRTPTNYFIINLAIADLLLGTTVLPVSATLEILNYWVFGRILCDIWAAVDVLCCTASIMSLCVISIDRYIGVSHPLQYPGIVTERRALLAMLGVWVLSVVISIGPLLGWKQPPSPDDTVCLITEEPFYALFSSLGSFYIPLVVILAMYCRVYIVAKRTTKNLEAGVMRERMNSGELTLRIHKGSHVHDDSVTSGSKGRAHQARSSLTVKLLKFSREKKAAKTLGVVVGMFTLCWLPFFLALPIGSFNVNLRPPEFLFKVIFWLGYFNSCLNPIIYPCYSREFKMAFIQILRCQCHRRRRPGWRAYNYRSSNFNSSAYSRKSSTEHNSGCLNGSQRTLPSSASPSPSYMSRSLPPCPEGDNLYIWGADTSPSTTPNLLPGSPSDCEAGGPRGEARGGCVGSNSPEVSSGGVFSFSFGQNRGRETLDKGGITTEDAI